MTKRILSSELKDHIGKEVLVKGWILTLRELGKVMFVLVRDADGVIQVVITDKKQMKEITKYQPETVVEVIGKVADAKGKTDLGVEIQDPEFKILSSVNEPLPVLISKKEIDANLNTILDNRPVTLRHPHTRAVFKIQAVLVDAFREYLQSLGFVEHFAPTIVGAATEGGAEVFKVKYFEDEATLAQSGQLYKQIMVGVYEKTFAIGHTYRAELHFTSRHITEFVQFEVEMGFIDSWTEILDVQEGLIRSMVKTIDKRCKKELELLGKELPALPKGEIPRIKFADAFEKVLKRKLDKDLSPEDERTIGEWGKKEHGSDFVMVTHYPEEKRPFYTHLDPEDDKFTNSFDTICRGAEITTGGQRIHLYDDLVKGIKRKGMNPEDYKDYLQIFKYGMPPEGGFAMGMERTTQMFLGLDNIREASLFPRDVKRKTP